MPTDTDPDQLGIRDRIAKELDFERGRVRKLREELRVAEALVAKLERLGNPSADTMPRVGVSPDVHRRRGAMIEILANAEPMGPAEILVELQNVLGIDAAGTRHQVTDLLRRDGAFVNPSRGQWALSPEIRKQLGNAQEKAPINGKHVKPPAQEPAAEDYDFEDIPF